VVATGTADELKRRIGAEQVELRWPTGRDRARPAGCSGRACRGRREAAPRPRAPAPAVVRVPTDGSADHLRYVLDTLAAGGSR
jgi:hypothetical protein